ncbi:hypothetical protein O181_073340 [Austropuccinia psidii MF-1]|uniref:CCHC-type domain-containing protein n=1 Tax=Austropuccinia psidii MF-1 TaxID=1389203 RepID=A0A9Q3F2A8_9BASI|nr:hypothetical protein [Austropuccinia psidii MF-1]
MKILKKCEGELEHALRSRGIEPCSTEDYINALEDIVTRTRISRTWKKLDIKSPNKPFIKKDKAKEAFNPNTSNNNEQIKCHKCGGIGHLANKCLKKAKINEIVETENHNDKEEEYDSEKETEESEASETYAPLSRRPAYPASPRAREGLEGHIKELMDLGVLRKVGHIEQVEVTTPVIITWHNGKSRVVGEFKALNTYTIPDRYPIPRIHETLTQLSQAKFITAMDALKGFNQNVLTENAKKLLRITVHCVIFEYLRMPFGIKNAQSQYHRMIDTIFPEELSEGWLIIYIDDIIVFSETWDNHLSRLERVLK